MVEYEYRLNLAEVLAARLVDADSVVKVCECAPMFVLTRQLTAPEKTNIETDLGITLIETER